MRLWLFHPALAAIACEDCQKWMYDFETGERETYRAGPSREEKLKTWPRGTGPQCATCPKESPAKEREHMLSAKNWRTLMIYQEVRATGGHCLTDAERTDRILRRNLATIDGLVRIREHQRLVTDLSHLWPVRK